MCKTQKHINKGCFAPDLAQASNCSPLAGDLITHSVIKHTLEVSVCPIYNHCIKS